MAVEKTQRIDIRYVLVMVVLLLFCVSGVLFYFMGGHGKEVQLQQLQSSIDDLNVQIAEQKDLNNEKDMNVVYSTTGINGAKVQADGWEIESLCDTAFTWSSYADYIKARDTLIDRYGVPEDSYFMTTFFPELSPYESDGQMVNDIDDMGINCSFEKVDTYLSGMDGDTYSYICFVQFSSRSENDYEAVSKAVVMCSADASHNLSDVRAFVAY